MEYSAYDAIVYGDIKTTCIFLVVLLCFAVFVIPLFIIPFSKSKDKEDKTSAKLIALLLLITFLAGAVSLIPGILDITQDSYVRFEGFIIVEEMHISSGGKNPYYATITLPNESDSKKYKVKCSYEVFSSMDEGQVYGYVVISKHTQFVLDWGILQ
ncbi:MAG: hypothetical protein IKJ35_06815 [Clostridia bacterium]|nr:hypothetical protein [Clostridia bacterium]